jgi:hypothetical protein
VTQGSWTDFISVAAIVIVVLSPLLRRVYIERFWVRGRGTVIRLEGGISNNPGAGGAWGWTPVIEYDAAGQQFSSRFSYWQLLNAKPKYVVGDQVEILYSSRNPSRFVLDSWDSWITYITTTIFIGFAIMSTFVPRNPSPCAALSGEQIGSRSKRAIRGGRRDRLLHE